MTGPGDERIFGMIRSKWEEFQFIAGQLAVIDNKAKSILQINAILIAITNISFFIEKEDSTLEIKIISAIANALILLSTAICIKTIWIKWSSGNNLVETPLSISVVIKLRNSKTLYLHWSLILLGLGLAALFLLVVVRTIF